MTPDFTTIDSAELAALRLCVAALQVAGDDVVRRWHSPMWSHKTHTSVYIAALCAALAQSKEPK